MAFFKDPSQKVCYFSLFTCYWKSNPHTEEVGTFDHMHEVRLNYADHQQPFSLSNSKHYHHQKTGSNSSQNHPFNSTASSAKFGQSQKMIFYQKQKKTITEGTCNLKKGENNKMSLKNQTRTSKNRNKLYQTGSQRNKDEEEYFGCYNLLDKPNLRFQEYPNISKKEMGVQYQPEFGKNLTEKIVEEVQSPYFPGRKAPVCLDNNEKRFILPLNKFSFKKKSLQQQQQNRICPAAKNNFSKRSDAEEGSTRYYSNPGVISSVSKRGTTSILVKNSSKTFKQERSSRLLMNLNQIQNSACSFSDEHNSQRQSLVMSMAQSDCSDSKFSQGSKIYRTIKRLTSKNL